MKLFLDTANLDEIARAWEWGVMDGVTTNPALIAREGRPIHEQIKRICEIVNGDVSAAVVSTSSAEMVEEGRALARIHENIVVKCPLTRDGIRATNLLARDGIRVNVTLCFSAAQALLAARAGAYMLSPFVGRLDDTGVEGMNLIRDIAAVYRESEIQTQILAASIRGPLPVIEAAKSGAHIVTIPLKVLEQMFDHPLTERGLDQFLKEYRTVFQEESAAR